MASDTIGADPHEGEESLWYKVYLRPQMLLLLCLGFASGLPSPLIFSNLSIWLRSVDVSRTDIGYFAFATTPLALNFLWAPFVDHLRLPFFSKTFGQRRGWAIFVQSLVMIAILLLSFSDPTSNLARMAILVIFLSFCSATLDVVLDAFRVELLKLSEQGAGASVYIAGWYLGGMLIGGAVGLMLAERFGWNAAYLLLAMAGSVGLLAVLFSPEPKELVAQRAEAESRRTPEARGWEAIEEWIEMSVIEPFREFMKRDYWLLILSFVFVFRLGDALLGRMSGVFYRDMGFSLTEIATVSKVYGLTATLVGIVLGGILATRIGVLKALFVSGLATALTNLTYSWLAMAGHDMGVFIFAVVSDNFTSGLVNVAFVAYLSSLCNVAFTATQYALLASLGNLSRILFSGVSGWMVDSLHGSWAFFFWITAIVALAGLPLLLVLMRKIPQINPTRA
ncbi:MAG: MFS transporter [Bradymonadales bacterium]|nr:MAG: MFS transporter [Bradymonadales bacterium]